MSMLKILSSLIDMEKDSKEYQQYIYNKYVKFMKDLQMDIEYNNVEINKNKLGGNYLILYNNISTIINNGYNFNFCIGEETIIEPFMYCLAEKYFYDCMKNDLNLKTIIYIDTIKLSEDFSSIINMRKYDSEIPLNYKDIINSDLYNASTVFWGNFDKLTNNLLKDKVISVIDKRQRSNLSNVYFTKAPNKLKECYETKYNTIHIDDRVILPTIDMNEIITNNNNLEVF